jgi:LmbE family N-acetylglucosaminyl deacetylase
VRERELREAAKIIGVAELVILDYQDQQLANAPTEAMREHIGLLIRRHRPEVVVTFDPDGGNRHTDHVAISRFTSDAIPCAADPRWRPDLGPPYRVRRLVWTGGIEPLHQPDIAAVRTSPGVDFLIDISTWRDTKARVLLAHGTQRAGVDRVFLQRPDRDRVLGHEIFRLGAGDMPPSVPSDDLYAGLVPG